MGFSPCGVVRKACRIAGQKSNVAACVVTYVATAIVSEERAPDMRTEGVTLLSHIATELTSHLNLT